MDDTLSGQPQASSAVGVIGASSLVGQSLLPLLAKRYERVMAFSRQPAMNPDSPASMNVSWRSLGETGDPIALWISLAPIWMLPDHFSWMASRGAKRLVALSSTSVTVKMDADDPEDRKIARQLALGEEQLREASKASGFQWLILRPTLIYGLGRDQNVGAIARFISRFGFFPLAKSAGGLRQPLHVNDAARACVAALENTTLSNRAYVITGGETLAYHEMVNRVFTAMGRMPRTVSLPEGLLTFMAFMVSKVPGFRHISYGMIARMNKNQVFDGASDALLPGVSPRSFHPDIADLPAAGSNHARRSFHG